MKVIIHDLGPEFNEAVKERFDVAIDANGRYAACQGCFRCWTRHPAECFMKDKLQQVSRTVGAADELVIVTENGCFGSYSPEVKAVLDRSIGGSTPLSTYRGGQMHHVLRYGPQELLKVYVYGETFDTPERERETFRLLVERNALNYGSKRHEVVFLDHKPSAEEVSA